MNEQKIMNRYDSDLPPVDFPPLTDLDDPGIPEGWVVVTNEDGCFLAPDLTEEEYTEIFGAPLTWAEYAESASIYDECGVWTDEEIEALADQADAIADGLDYAASCYDELTEYDRLIIFGGDAVKKEEQ